MKKYKSHQSGSVFFPIVLFASLWLVTMTVYLFYYMHLQNKQQDVEAYKELNQKLKSEVERPLADYLQALEALVGFPEQDLKRVSLEKLVSTINKLRSDKTETGTKSYYGVYGLSSPEILEEKLVSTSYPINIEVILSAFEARIIELQEQEKILQEAISEFEEDIKSKRREYEEIKEQHSNRISELKREKENLDEKYSNFINKVIEQKELAIQSKDTLKEERRKNEDQLKAKRLEYDNLILKKMSDIRLLQAEKYGGREKQLSQPKLFSPAEEPIDGEIVFGDPLSNTIYVSLGRKNKVFRGLKFDVFRLIDKGNKEYKGRIEVKRVMDKISETMVIELANNNDPIVSGDVIINPVFSENRPVYVTFTEGHISKSRFEKLVKDIQEVGGVVEKQVTSKTNFVIIDNANKGQEHENYAAAVEFKIPLINEKTLMKYIGDQ